MEITEPTTDWFGVSEKPVHVGVYLVEGKAADYWCYWTGTRWGSISGTRQGAVGMRDRPGFNQHRRWKGVYRGETA